MQQGEEREERLTIKELYLLAYGKNKRTDYYDESEEVGLYDDDDEYTDWY